MGRRVSGGAPDLTAVADELRPGLVFTGAVDEGATPRNPRPRTPFKFEFGREGGGRPEVDLGNIRTGDMGGRRNIGSSRSASATSGQYE